jgi:hypothetical protein
MWARLVKRLLVIGIVASLSFLLAARWAIRQSQKVPEFYQQAIAAAPPENLAESSRELEQRVEQLHAEVAQTGTWSAEFDADQINAWLAAELPKRFPTVQAKGLQDPRVMISEGKLTLAARFTNQRIDAVLSCELTAQLTEQPNRLAVRIDNLRVGALPLPLSKFKQLIAKAAARLHLNVTWEEADEGTVALVELADRHPSEQELAEHDAVEHHPAEHDRSEHDPPEHAPFEHDLVERKRDDPAAQGERFTIELIELREAALIVAGQSGEAAHQAFNPQGPIYSIASAADEPESPVTLSSRNVQNEELGSKASAH